MKKLGSWGKINEAMYGFRDYLASQPLQALHP
jgi:hypothetical protein